LTTTFLHLMRLPTFRHFILGFAAAGAAADLVTGAGAGAAGAATAGAEAVFQKTSVTYIVEPAITTPIPALS
jgi:hypothetical protein